MTSEGVVPPDRKPPPPLAKQTRKDVDSAFEQFSSLIRASNRPLPNRFGNGDVVPEEKRTGIFTDIGVLRRGGFLLESISTLYAVFQQHKKGGPVDDRRMIVCCSNLPPPIHFDIIFVLGDYSKHDHGLMLNVDGSTN